MVQGRSDIVVITPRIFRVVSNFIEHDAPGFGSAIDWIELEVSFKRRSTAENQWDIEALAADPDPNRFRETSVKWHQALKNKPSVKFQRPRRRLTITYTSSTMYVELFSFPDAYLQCSIAVALHA